MNQIQNKNYIKAILIINPKFKIFETNFVVFSFAGFEFPGLSDDLSFK